MGAACLARLLVGPLEHEAGRRFREQVPVRLHQAEERLRGRRPGVGRAGDRTLEDQLRYAVWMLRRESNPDRAGDHRSVQCEPIDAEGGGDGLEVTYVRVKREVGGATLREAAAAVVVADYGVVLGKLFEPAAQFGISQIFSR